MLNIIKKIFFSFLPIKKKRVVIMSFNGHYSDSPKYLYQELRKYDDLEIIWLIDKKYMSKMPNNMIFFDINSFKGEFYYWTANVIIDNVYGNKETYLNGNTLKDKIIYFLRNKLRYKKNQYVFTTWHGTPLKRMGKDQINSKIIDFSCPNTTMILGNEYTYNIMKNLSFNKINMKLIGTPRNDLLFSSDLELKNKLKKKLGLNKRVILFAPSFRSNDGKNDIYRSGINQLKEIDFEKLFEIVEKKFGEEWIFVCRFHYHVEKMINWNEIEEKYNGKVVNGNKYDDMSEYLFCSDILITDVSSCMFDFMLTKKPIFMYFPDIDYYETKERGFYMDINKLPFSMSIDFEKLVNNINNFDLESYVNNVNNFINKLGYVDSKDSSNKVSKYIYDYIKR